MGKLLERAVRKVVENAKVVENVLPTSMAMYVFQLKQTHNDSTRASILNNIVIPKNRNNLRLRTFHSNDICQWNSPYVKLRTTSSLEAFKNLLHIELVSDNACI